MKKFSFSMQKILDLRIFEQRQAEIELGKANAEVARIQGELDSIAKRKVSTIKNFDTNTDFLIQAEIQSFFFMLEQKKEKFLEELATAQIAADEKREVVRNAMQKVKVLERLKENKFRQWKKDSLKAEELAADDIVTARKKWI
ncbi:flagellar export protein FliJ [uncultured Treponema sp.]|uniref:flagellar export protein FliJ n=1 Tax=uncultured Treponema sp. TaxID=162155 RepID=UPI000E860165|nr:flagellar export protein FliJ [uncultured Treponema sp.]HAZ95908.1 flagellar export protein FliJ [Treponema sp.]